ncbi:MAG: SNF2-related protein, partial [Pseudomonadota bacterium]
EMDATASEKMLQADLVFPDEHSPEAMHFAFTTVPQLQAEGWQIDIDPSWPYRLIEKETTFTVETTPAPGDAFGGHDWFSFGFQVMIGKEPVDIAEVIAGFLEQCAEIFDPTDPPELETFEAMLAQHPVYLKHGKAGYVALYLTPLASLLHLFLHHHGDTVGLHPSDASLAREAQDALEGSDVAFADHAGILPLANAFAGLSDAGDYQPPEGLTATLRPYQAFGAEWMTRLVSAGFGGILADDMGLGKTVQALAALLTRKGRGPSLLIAPTSLLHGWQTQAAQFAPKMRLLTLHGPSRRDLIADIPAVDLVLTTYPLLARDREILAARPWDLVIVDEAQTLKNPASQMAKALREIPSAGRLALTV